jgi:hypothetical protein
MTIGYFHRQEFLSVYDRTAIALVADEWGRKKNHVDSSDLLEMSDGRREKYWAPP